MNGRLSDTIDLVERCASSTDRRGHAAVALILVSVAGWMAASNDGTASS